MNEPFWEAGYTNTQSPSVFGQPSDELQALIGRLPKVARVLDLGCGDGRNTLFLLGKGLDVTAVDVSSLAMAKLVANAGACEGRLHPLVADARDVPFQGPYDLIIAHGLLHLMSRFDWSLLIKRMQCATSPDGYNVVAVFTNTIPPPPELGPFMLGLFREGELLEHYRAWRIELYRSYVLDDEHPGGIRHRHPVNKIVAQNVVRVVGADHFRGAAGGGAWIE